MKPQHTRALLAAGLLGTLVLVWLAPQDETAVPRTPARSSKAQPVAAPLSDTAAVDTVASIKPARGNARVAAPALRGDLLTRPEREAAPDDGVNLFQATTWFIAPPPPPPPPPAAPPPPPPAPTAPALPFVFLGQIIEDDQAQVILARGDRVITVIVGDAIDKTYRLESLQKGVLTFVYLPLATRQTLATGVPQ
jgi:hypothetical protein